MSNLKFNRIIVLSILSVGLTACGGGGGSNGPKVYTGVFKDSNVQGLTYKSGAQKGITGKNGEFRYEADSNITFSIGGTALGSAAKAKNIMTPLDLVEGGTIDSADVINRIRFLMMLDKDNDPSNGIEISAAVQNIAKKSWGDLDFSSSSFDDSASMMASDASAKDGKPHYTPTVDAAKEHFNKTLTGIKATKRCSDSGAFVGTFTGDEEGNIVLLLDPTSNGKITGSLYRSDAAVEVVNTTAIDYDTLDRNFVSKTDRKTFVGSLKEGNILEGTWTDIDDPTKKGEFKTTRTGGDSGATYRYSAAYQGKTTPTRGVIALDVYSNSTIKGKFVDVSDNKEITITGSIKNDDLVGVKLSNGEQMKGYIDVDVITASVVGITQTFDASRCKLNKK